MAKVKHAGVDLVWSDLTVRYGDTVALQGVNGFVPAGKMVAVMGQTGAGKSSLLKALADQVKVESGKILYDGKRLQQAGSLQRHIGIVDQDDIYMKDLTVRECLMQTAMFYNANKKQCEQAVDRFLGLLQIDFVGAKRIDSISGGQRKRFCICRELVANPELLLCDEPTSGLDSALARILIEQLRKIADEENTTILCSIQQPSENMFLLFDLIVFIHQGQIVYYGPPTGVLAHIYHFGKGMNIEIDDGVPNFLMDVITNNILKNAGGFESARDATTLSVKNAIKYYVVDESVKERQLAVHGERDAREKVSIVTKTVDWFRHVRILIRRFTLLGTTQLFDPWNFSAWIIFVILISPITKPSHLDLVRTSSRIN